MQANLCLCVFVPVCVCVDYGLEESWKKAAVPLNDNLSELFYNCSSSFISLSSLSPSLSKVILLSAVRVVPNIPHRDIQFLSYKVTLTAVLAILLLCVPFLQLTFFLYIFWSDVCRSELLIWSVNIFVVNTHKCLESITFISIILALVRKHRTQAAVVVFCWRWCV